jgi:hypothetical protein
MIPEPIAEFDAFVSRVQTMADGSPRVVLDMSEDRIDLLTTLAKTRTDSMMLTVLVFMSRKITVCSIASIVLEKKTFRA